jgi:toxin ParE1/3/4
MTGVLTRTDQAERDLLAIWEYIARENISAADALLDDLDQASEALAVFPSMGPNRPDLAPEIRYFPRGNYLIIYRPKPRGVEIVRYLRAERDLVDALSDSV